MNLIFNPSELPQTEFKLLHYGGNEIDILLQHYSKGPLAGSEF